MLSCDPNSEERLTSERSGGPSPGGLGRRSVLNHLSVFREIVSDLQSMEVKLDDENLALLQLVSLPSSFGNFRDTILLSHHDELTLAEVYEALQQREKIKSMVQAEGSSSKAEAL